MCTTKYIKAVLPNGTVLTRSTFHDYTHAWALFRDGSLIRSGFASSRAKADKAGQAARSLWAPDDIIRKRDRAKTPTQRKYYCDIISQNGGEKAFIAARNAALETLTVIVVEAVEQ
jgi:hypothetical protein